jgi:aspartate/methionine/tyrosine aminotransferase
MQIASRLEHVSKIGVEDMGDRANAAATAGAGDILRLENLDTDLAPPREAIAATRAVVGDDDANSYLPFFGSDRLRQAAARHVAELSRQSYDWRTECVITAGGLSGILNTLLATLNPGDEVVMTDPIYVGLINRVRLAGGVPRFVPLRPDGGAWRLDVDALRRAGSPRTRMALMMSPSMPTGGVLSREDWDAVAAFCHRHNCWLLNDAAMERILYDDSVYVHPAGLPGMRDRTITVGSVSKEYRMIGWRVGWVVGPSSVVPHVGRVSISNVVCQVGIGMPGAAAALEAADAGIAASVVEWQQRRDALLAELAGLPVARPAGGWSLLLDVSGFGLDGPAASARLIARARIAATPMINWGTTSAARYVRFVFANEPVARLTGIRARLEAALRG